MIPFLVAALTLGTLVGIWLSTPPALSGKLALGLALAPLAGFGLAIVFC